jgi:DGQHR domain-containing protein
MTTKTSAKTATKKPTKTATIDRRALRLQQSPDCLLYIFTLTAAQILQIADISRVSRDQSGDLIGYQRPEVRQHIQEITDYLDGKEIIFPNPIIIALPTTVKFTNGRGIPCVGDGADQGRIHIPVPAEGTPKVGWIVDGQQRALALARSQHQDLAVPVNAFVTDSIDIQRDQFLRINNTRPLPRGLVTELLPSISSPLPLRLALRKAPSELCDLLNSDDKSPFYGLIKRSSTSAEQRKQTTITDTSIVNMLNDSLTQPSGCLFPFRNMSTGETDYAGIWQMLLTYWNAVKETFPDAWGQSPAQSRLMHGAGLRAMGRLMDRVMATVDVRQKAAVDQVLKDLSLIAPYCHWTSGTWDELDMRWNDIQNLGRDMNKLSNYLIRVYLREKATQP